MPTDVLSLDERFVIAMEGMNETMKNMFLLMKSMSQEMKNLSAYVYDISYNVSQINKQERQMMDAQLITSERNCNHQTLTTIPEQVATTRRHIQECEQADGRALPHIFDAQNDGTSLQDFAPLRIVRCEMSSVSSVDTVEIKGEIDNSEEPFSPFDVTDTSFPREADVEEDTVEIKGEIDNSEETFSPPDVTGTPFRRETDVEEECPTNSSGFSRVMNSVEVTRNMEAAVEYENKETSTREKQSSSTGNNSTDQIGKQNRGMQPFSCKTCGKCFPRFGLLENHMRTHTGEKPYECQICPRAFASKSNLKRHNVVHTAVRSYTCNDCKAEFKFRSNLIRHLRCRICKKPLP